MTDSDQQLNKNEERPKYPRKPCFIAVEGATWDSAFDGFINILVPYAARGN